MTKKEPKSTLYDSYLKKNLDICTDTSWFSVRVTSWSRFLPTYEVGYFQWYPISSLFFLMVWWEEYIFKWNVYLKLEKIKSRSPNTAKPQLKLSLRIKGSQWALELTLSHSEKHRKQDFLLTADRPQVRDKANTRN